MLLQLIAADDTAARVAVAVADVQRARVDDGEIVLAIVVEHDSALVVRADRANEGLVEWATARSAGETVPHLLHDFKSKYDGVLGEVRVLPVRGSVGVGAVENDDGVALPGARSTGSLLGVHAADAAANAVVASKPIKKCIRSSHEDVRPSPKQTRVEHSAPHQGPIDRLKSVAPGGSMAQI